MPRRMGQGPLDSHRRVHKARGVQQRRRPKGEGSIRQRSDGKWVGRFYYEDPISGLARRAQVTATTKKEVSAQLRHMTQRVDAGAAARDDSALFGVFAASWLESSLPASSRKATTKLLYAGLTRNHIIGSDLGKLPMKNLRPTFDERFVTQLRAKGLSDSTVRQVYTVARAIGDDALRDGRLARNPFATVRRPRVNTAEAQFLELYQIHALLEAARTPGMNRCSSSWCTAGCAEGRRSRSHGPTSTCQNDWYESAARWRGSTVKSKSSSRSQPSLGVPFRSPAPPPPSSPACASAPK